MDVVKIGDEVFEGHIVPLPKRSFLLIRAKNGVLGCGYLNVDAAEKFQDAVAIVSGVACYDDMLHAQVCKVSSTALALGVQIGMTGRQALQIMN